MLALFKAIPNRFSRFKKELSKTTDAIGKKWRIVGLTEQEVYERNLELSASEIRRSDIVIHNLIAVVITAIFAALAWYYIIVKHLSQ